MQYIVIFVLFVAFSCCGSAAAQAAAAGDPVASALERAKGEVNSVGKVVAAADDAKTDTNILGSGVQDEDNVASEQAVYPGVRNRRLESGGHGEPTSTIWYPQFGNGVVDGLLRDFVEKCARDYEDEVKEGLGENGEKPESWEQWEQNGFFTLSKPNPDVASVTFNIYSYTGGAHGQIFIVVFNFDLKTSKQLELKNLFAEPEKALAIMSQVSVAQLQKSLGEDVDEDMLKDGTEPDVANFSCLVLTPAGVTVEFQPYQVGPWSIGQQHVDIPLADLEAAKPNPAIWISRK